MGLAEISHLPACRGAASSDVFRSKAFTLWFFSALTVWVALFYRFCSPEFLAAHFHYPLIMVLGAFVAGLTPEGGGAVAFPVLSVFFSVDRILARDFSLMIQNIGMTSASIFILSNPRNDRRVYKPLLWFIPVTFAGFFSGCRSCRKFRCSSSKPCFSV
jgi:hypothetical protein